MHAALLAEIDDVVAVLDLLEARQLRLIRRDTDILFFLTVARGIRLVLRARLRLADAPPDD